VRLPIGKSLVAPEHHPYMLACTPGNRDSVLTVLDAPDAHAVQVLGWGAGRGGRELVLGADRSDGPSTSLTKLAFTYATRSMGSSFSSTMTRAQST
jgi:hypothetical protein